MSDIVQCLNCGAKNRLGSAKNSRDKPRCGRCGADLPWLVNATDNSFENEAAAPMPALVDLWAPWCGPCRVVGPVLEDLSRELTGKLKVIKINVDENPRLAARFDARSIPTLVLFKDGAVVERVVGVKPKPVLKQLVERHL